LKGLFFPFENKILLANNKKVAYIKKNGHYFTLQNDSLIFYDRLGQILNIKKNIQNYVLYEEFDRIEIETNKKLSISILAIRKSSHTTNQS